MSHQIKQKKNEVYLKQLRKGIDDHKLKSDIDVYFT